MTRRRPARCGMGLLGAMWIASQCLVVTSSARADAPHVVWVSGRPEGEVAGRARRWQHRVARALGRDGVAVSEELERWAWEREGSDATQVARLARVESLIRRAHEAREQLDPRAAMRALAAADAEVRAALDVAGASAWYAEVEIALAVTAAEIGEMALAEAALTRAATIDPGRVLRAAEAPPALVERARSIARAVATGPRGRFEVRAPVEGAQVWLDERLIATAPTRVEASVGTHVLRVEAPGHRTWARVIDVLEGTRAPVEIALAPQPGLAAARALRDATEARSLEGVVTALDALAGMGHAPLTLWLVEASAGAMDRAVVVPCRAGGCDAPLRMDASRAESVLPRDPDAPGEALASVALVGARHWLDEPIQLAPPPPPSVPWWEEPWPWAIAGAVVLGAVALSVGATWPAPQSRDRFVVDVREPWQ